MDNDKSSKSIEPLSRKKVIKEAKSPTPPKKTPATKPQTSKRARAEKPDSY